MRKLVLLVAVMGVALYAAPATAQAFECGTTLDDFNRGNSTTLGSSWTEVVADPQISAQQFTNPNGTLGLATFGGIESNEACVDVSSSASLSYAAIVLKYLNTSNMIFVKLQDNNSPFTGFDTIYFYRGNSSNPFSPSQPISPVVPSARFHVKVEGNVVTADIDTNFDNQPEKVYTVTTAPTTGLGTTIGLGGFGGARLDNFSIPKAAVPPGSTKFSCAGTAATKVGTSAGDVINGTSGNDVIVAQGGTDLVRGRGGKDVICGGTGADKLVGGPGKDRLFGQAGKDQLVGGPKNDVCAGGPGKDTSIAC
jgi:Ca2+-binding RTX toxin-like protein